MALSKHWKTGRYGFEYLMLTRSIQPSAYYENDGYVGSAFGTKTSVYPTMEEAKAAVESGVFRILDSALARLNDKASSGTNLAQTKNEQAEKA